MRKFQWSKHQWPDCMRLCRLVDKSLIVCWVITFRLSCHDFDFLWASQETAGPHETSALTTTVPFVGSQQRRLWAHESSFWWRKAESLHHHTMTVIEISEQINVEHEPGRKRLIPVVADGTRRLTGPIRRLRCIHSCTNFIRTDLTKHTLISSARFRLLMAKFVLITRFMMTKNARSCHTSKSETRISLLYKMNKRTTHSKYKYD